jgi:hypothetical protein
MRCFYHNVHLRLQFESSHACLHLKLGVPRSLRLIRCGPLLPAKDGEECACQDSTTAVEDVVQGNKGQSTITTDDRYDAC